MAVEVPAGDLAKIQKAAPGEAPAKLIRPRRVLVFTLAKGFVHEATPWGVAALRIVGEKTGAYTIVASEDPNVFERDSLAKFDAVCFLNTCYTPFTNAVLKQNLMDFVKDGKTAMVADRDGQLHAVALDDLTRARGSKFKPFPPRNALFTFDFSAAREPLANETRLAINEVVKGMLHPPVSNLGVRGIRKAADCLRKWPKTMTPEELRMACFNAFIFIDSTGGTGGGIFRYMYGRFLKEAAGIIGAPDLAAVGDRMKAIGDQWQAAAGLLHRAAELPNGGAELSEAADIMEAIAGEEQGAWGRLQALG